MEEVVVSARRLLIDFTSTELGGNLAASIVDALATERDYGSVISCLPEANASFQGDGVNASAVGTGSANSYFIDGVNVTDPYQALKEQAFAFSPRSMKNLNHRGARSTIARVLKEHGIKSAPDRPASWATFVR